MSKNTIVILIALVILVVLGVMMSNQAAKVMSESQSIEVPDTSSKIKQAK